MTPEIFFQWAVAIAFGSGIVLFCLPIDRWIGNYLMRRHTRLKELEERVAALEQQRASNQQESS